MDKNVSLKGKIYHIQIKWSGSSYCVLCSETGSSVIIPNDCLDDIEKVKRYILRAITYEHDLIEIEKWDGVLMD